MTKIFAVAYYRDTVLMQEMLSFTGAIAVVTLTSSSKTSAPVHHACQTAELLQRETTKFIGPDLWTPNSPDLNPANYHIQLKTWLIWDNAWLTRGVHGFSQEIVADAIDEWCKRLHLLMNGMKREAILNTCNTSTLLRRKTG